jgi:long-chain acyl-CoA synthetase
MRPHLASLVEDMRRNGAQTALVWYRGVRRHAASYAEMARLAGRFAAEFSRRGLQPGDRVVIWGANSVEWVGAFFGCLMSGVLAVPLDAAGSADFAERVVADVAPGLIVGDRERLRQLGVSIARMEFETASEQLPAQAAYEVHPEVKLDAPFQIVFTSGTTAEPKGIVHTHRNVLASVAPIEREMGKYRRYERLVHPLRMLHSLPLSHVYGQFLGLWMAPLLAMEVHLEPRLDAARVLRRIPAEKINMLVAVPRTLELLRARLLAEDPALADELAEAIGISPWQRWWRFRRVHRRLGWRFWALICGGAALPAELELFWGRLGLAVIQGYGMTETAALITLNHPFHAGRGTLGKPLPGREVRLSEAGEIQVRGEMVSTATWRGGRVERRERMETGEDEWLATGDLATMDEQGALRFAGRQGETIVTAAGLNVYPADLEAALLRQPGVRAAAVVGCAGTMATEPVAVLLCESDAVMRRAVEGANAELAEFQRMRRALRWPEPALPYTATGKLMRRQVANWACAELAGRESGGREAGKDALLAMVVQVTGVRVAEAGDSARLSEDLGLDSLGRVQLQALLEERFGISLDEETMARAGTLGDLRRMVGLSAVGGVAAASDRGVDARVTGEPLPSAPAGELASAPAAGRPFADGLQQRYPRWTWWSWVNALRVGFQEVAVRAVVWVVAAPRVVRGGTVSTRPLLIVANHGTSYDVPLVLYALPWAVRRRVAVAMSGELLLEYRRGRRAVVGWLDPLMPVAYWLITALFNVFPLPRLGGFRQSFEHAGAALDAGYSVMIFPEGRRSGDGRLAPFRAGIGLLVRESEADVLPVALAGLGAARRSGRWLRPGIAVRVGEAMHFGAEESAEAITAALERAVAGLLERG